MLGHEVIVVEVGIGSVHPLDFLGLPRRQNFSRIEAAQPLYQPLAPQHRVDPRNTAGELVGHVEEGGVGIRHLGGPGQHLGGDARRRRRDRAALGQ